MTVRMMMTMMMVMTHNDDGDDASAALCCMNVLSPCHLSSCMMEPFSGGLHWVLKARRTIGRYNPAG